MIKRTIVGLFLILFSMTLIFSDNKDSIEYKINKTSEDIKIDGILDETAWEKAKKIRNFKQIKPHKGKPVSYATSIRALYSAKMIYFAFVCDDPNTNKIVASKSRDGAIGTEDSVVILLDTFNDNQNAYLFAVNSRGGKLDLKILQNGKSWDMKWDKDWQFACKVNQTNWVAEIGIPFKQIAFDKNGTSMGFTAIRNIPRIEEEASIVLEGKSLFDVSKFASLSNLDLTDVDFTDYEKNVTKHKNAYQEFQARFIKADKYILKEDLFYKTDKNLTEYEKKRCFLDLYLPAGQKDFPVMVWFYAGSLQRGSRKDTYTQDMAKLFAHKGLAVAVVDYRLSPKVKYPEYIKDAAASVKWVKEYIKKYNANPEQVFIAGHSAGAYLTLMLGLDRLYLENEGIKIDDIAGLIPLSGQTFTHYAIREERGIPDPKQTPIIDEAGPCYHSKSSGPPILLICGDKDGEDRKKENQYLQALLHKKGYENVEYLEAPDRTHFELVSKIPTKGDTVSKAILNFISKLGEKK